MVLCEINDKRCRSILAYRSNLLTHEFMAISREADDGSKSSLSLRP